MARPPSAANKVTTRGQARAAGVKHQVKPLCQPSVGVGQLVSLEPVRTFFTASRRLRCAAPLARPPPGSALERPPGTGAPTPDSSRKSAKLTRPGCPVQRDCLPRRCNVQLAATASMAAHRAVACDRLCRAIDTKATCTESPPATNRTVEGHVHDTVGY